MRRTYELTVNGYDQAKVEQAIRLMDQIVRRWYNVYGGKRTYSGKGAGGEWYVFVEYTADWVESGLWVDWDDIRKGFYKRLMRFDQNDELEVHTRPMPWLDGR